MDEPGGRRSATQLIIDGATAWGAAAGGTGTLLLGAAAATHVFGSARERRRARRRADAFKDASASPEEGLVAFPGRARVSVGRGG